MQDSNLIADLRATDDRHIRMFWICRSTTEKIELALHEQPSYCRQSVRYAFRRGMCPVSGSKSIVDENVRKRCQLPRKFGIVGLFARVETHVLEQQHRAGFKPVDGLNRVRPDRLGDVLHGLPEQLLQSFSHRP